MDCRRPGRIFCPVNRCVMFTLMELLVVVSIIVILAGMLMPAVLRGLGKARSTVCMSNLRQIAIGMMNYAAEHDEYACPAQPGKPVDHWLNYLYVESANKSPEVLQCPDIRHDDLFNPYGGEGRYGELKAASYIMNIIREFGVQGWSSLPAQISTPFPESFGWSRGAASNPIRMNWVRDPANKIWIMDSAPGIKNPSVSLGILRMTEADHGLIDANADGQVNAGERQVGWQHAKGFHVLFGDAHVEHRLHSEHEEWNVHQIK